MIKAYLYLNKINNYLQKFNGIAAAILLILLAVIVNMRVFTRNILNFTYPWVDQGSLFLITWVTFLGAAYGLREKSHISIEFLVDRFPEVVRKIIEYVIVIAIMVVAFYVLVIEGFDFVSDFMDQRIPTLGIRVGFSYLSIPVSGALMIIYSIELLLEMLIKDVKGDEVLKDD